MRNCLSYVGKKDTTGEKNERRAEVESHNSLVARLLNTHVRSKSSSCCSTSWTQPATSGRGDDEKEHRDGTEPLYHMRAHMCQSGSGRVLVLRTRPWL